MVTPPPSWVLSSLCLKAKLKPASKRNGCVCHLAQANHKEATPDSVPIGTQAKSHWKPQGEPYLHAELGTSRLLTGRGRSSGLEGSHSVFKIAHPLRSAMDSLASEAKGVWEKEEIGWWYSHDLLSAYYAPVTGLNALFFWILEALWNINCYIIILILHLRELGAHRVAVTHSRSHI